MLRHSLKVFPAYQENGMDMRWVTLTFNLHEGHCLYGIRKSGWRRPPEQRNNVIPCWNGNLQCVTCIISAGKKKLHPCAMNIAVGGLSCALWDAPFNGRYVWLVTAGEAATVPLVTFMLRSGQVFLKSHDCVTVTWHAPHQHADTSS